MPNDTYAQEQGILVRRSERLFNLALSHGLPLEIAADGESGVIRVERPRAFTVEEWLKCKEFLNKCCRRIQDIGRRMLEPVLARFEGHEINLGELLRQTELINLWEWQTIRVECRCRPTEERPEMPPGTTKTNNERDVLNAMNFHASPSISAAVGSGIYFAAPHEAVLGIGVLHLAEPITIWAGLAATMRYVGDKIATADPPDPNFDQLPVVLRPGRIELAMGSSSVAVQTAFNQALDLAAEQISLSRALLTAIERSQGAELAGQTNARDLQLSAAAEFAELLAPVLEAQAAARTALVAAIRADGATVVIGGVEMLDIVLPVFADGPSTHFARAIDHYGDGGQDANELWWKASASLFDGDDLGVFPEILNPPELALAEARAAEVYRGLASRWR